jgi:integrase
MIRGLTTFFSQPDEGIRKRVYPHLFRHSFATWALRRGMNPVQLKDILGHSSLALITDVYSHLAPEDPYVALMAAMRSDVASVG